MERIAIIGLGLIGGSLGLALKRVMGNEVEIVGFSRRRETIARARALEVIDKEARDLTSAVMEANLVVIATPVITIKDIMEQISGYLTPSCVVTDIGSTKVEVMKWAGLHLDSRVNFVGGHPMAGKETSGIDEADADLFQGCAYCLTPSPNVSRESVQTLTELIESIGARPVIIDAELHDSLVAGVSHLPTLLSAAFVAATAMSSDWPEMARLAAGGYRDMSRLASGDPGMNRDICITNKEQIVRWMDRYLDELKRYRSLITGDGEGLMEALTRAREAREKWLREDRR